MADLDLTVECITHRFTANSKDVLLGWYPMTEMRNWFYAELATTLPEARALYWT